jgi:hypothetical protein
LNGVNVDADIMKLAIGKQGVVLFDSMAGYTAACTNEEVEPADLSLGQRVFFAVKIIAIEREPPDTSERSKLAIALAT